MFVDIVDRVRARFVERGFSPEVSVVEGKECRSAQSNYGAGSANRIAFVPSKGTIALVPPLFIGEEDDGSPRQLCNALFAYDVAIAGYDANNPERDLAHRRKCVDLFEVVVQEAQRAYGSLAAWSDGRWDDLEKKHIAHGAELVFTLTINVPIFDIGFQAATPAGVPGQPKPVEG